MNKANVHKEEWRDIEGYEGYYQVSNLGRVKSLERERANGKGSYVQRELILKQSNSSTGYKKVELSKNKIKKSIKVHRLVAIAFIGKPTKEKKIINHKDGNPVNNNVENLEWCSQHENVLHAYQIGLHKQFEITKEQLYSLYVLKKMGTVEIGNKLKVSKTTISRKLREFGIKVRSVSEGKNIYNLTKEFLHNELIVKKVKRKDLSKKLGCSQGLISHTIKKFKKRGEWKS